MSAALQPLPSATSSLFAARPAAKARLRDFFSSHIRNSHTRRAYLEAVRKFSGFCAQHGITDLVQIEPVHVAAFVGITVTNPLEADGQTMSGRAAHALRLDGRRPGHSH